MQVIRDQSGILRLSGSIQISSAEELRTAFRDYIGEAATPIIDLSEADECDTAILQLLISARRTAEHCGKQFELMGLSPDIRDTTAALGLMLTEASKQEPPITPADPAGPTAPQKGVPDAL